MRTKWGQVVAFAVVVSAIAGAQQLPTFEVASVKEAPPFDPQKILSGQQRIGMRMDASRVDIDGLPLSEIINNAFRIKSYQVIGPSWLASGPNSPRFDVHATLPAGASTDQVPQMLQALLADRFKMTYHRENKDESVYALVVGKGGSKLVESPPDPPAASGPPPVPGATGLVGRGAPPVQVAANGRGAFTISGAGTGPMRMSMSPDGNLHIEAEKLSLSQFADTLARLLDRPVVDQTGLKGNYKVALDLTRDDLMNAARAIGAPIPPGAFGPAPAGSTAPAAADPSGTSIFASVEKLGLKLDARKTPIEHIVIDHLERTPTED